MSYHPYDNDPRNPENQEMFYAAICPECGESHGYLADECRNCGEVITEENYQFK